MLHLDRCEVTERDDLYHHTANDYAVTAHWYSQPLNIRWRCHARLLQPPTATDMVRLNWDGITGNYDLYNPACRMHCMYSYASHIPPTIRWHSMPGAAVPATFFSYAESSPVW